MTAPATGGALRSFVTAFLKRVPLAIALNNALRSPEGAGAAMTGAEGGGGGTGAPAGGGGGGGANTDGGGTAANAGGAEGGGGGAGVEGVEGTAVGATDWGRDGGRMLPKSCWASLLRVSREESSSSSLSSS